MTSYTHCFVIDAKVMGVKVFEDYKRLQRTGINFAPEEKVENRI